YLPANKSIHYYVNDGQFNFSPSTLTGINPAVAEATPTFLDVNNDGAQDIIVGAADGKLYYFKRTGQTTFEEQTGSNNPFLNFYRGPYSSPSAADFDNDGDKDLVVGLADNLLDFAYIENKGNGNFEEKLSFENPFGGASVLSESAPYFIDVDNDGDNDLVVGSSDNSDPFLKYFRNDGSKYTEVIENSPFSGTTVGNMFTPSFVDLDGDGDKDLVATADNGDMTYVDYFKNEGGTFVKQDALAGPFVDIYVGEGRGDFADLDKDNDYDFIATDRRWEMGDYRYFIRYFENTGTRTAPAFTERTGTSNPLGGMLEDFRLFPRFHDIDHDGDLDALIGESGNVVENADGNEFHFYENISTTNAPNFRYRGNLTQQGRNPYEPSPSFIDQDNDGDLDIFFGTIGGELVYYRNINPAAIIALNTTSLNVPAGTPVTIDPFLTVSDADSDSIVFAQVSIAGYVQGQEELDFNPVPGITGQFNTSTGVLTFSGKAPLADYQAILRTVTLTQLAAPANGRTRTPVAEHATITRTVSIQIADADRTNSTIVTRTVNFVSASAPVFADHTATVITGGMVSIDLKTLMADANNDIDLTTLTVTQTPSAGTATLNASGILSVSFAGVNFSGSTTVGLRVCDAGGLCDQSVITINVTNSAPVFANSNAAVVAGNSLTLDLKPLITDAENNIDLATASITQNPSSGASASVNAATNLVVNYQSVAFSGSETVRVSVCDRLGLCTTSTISITVSNTPPVFNSSSATISYHGNATINVGTLISDADGNVNLTSLAIASGSKVSGIATLSGTTLSLDYGGVNFAGSDNVQLRVCDAAGACAEATISVTIQNAAPVIQPEPISTSQGSTKSMNLLDVTSDSDGNLDASTFVIVQGPSSGATAQIEVISPQEVRLTINYAGLTFSGSDHLTIRACDEAGACTENIISIEVNSDIEIFNAIAPNSSGDNKFFRILNLPPGNKVTIFNRWGDVVYHANQYDNDAVKFEGFGDGGSALASGTYFYKIEYLDQSNTLRTITGYLSLKQ
ncbi:MAG TPA: FG-GAP-like repeat-containing protein, partial [Chryseosolibacter sp.]